MNLQMLRNSRYLASLSAIAATTLCMLGTAAVARGEISAEDLLQAAGRDQGLCVIIGCGDESDPGLAAALAKSGKLLVHGIALDDTCLARAQKLIAAASVEGLATVERLPLQPLPYRDNMANIVVVLNPKLATAAGFSTAEALRVLSPLGRLLINKDEQWETTVKPMPKDMDEWTHENHGPDGNTVSTDRCIHFPLGFRWNAGLPMNLQNPLQNALASIRGIALSGGRCFTMSVSEIDNLGPIFHSENGVDQYVTARDACNGVLLWRTKIGVTHYGGLVFLNRGPFVAVDQRVYVADEDGALLALDAATGRVARKFPTAYAPGRILVDRNIIVSAEWKDATQRCAMQGIDRRPMDFPISVGAIEAFDAQSGNRLWKIDKLATSICSADGNLFMVQREGPDQHAGTKKTPGQSKKNRAKADTELPLCPEQRVVAVELASGKLLWETEIVSPEKRETLRVNTAALGVITVAHDISARTSILSAKDGHVITTLTPDSKAGSTGVFYQGAFHLRKIKYDPTTGRELGESPISLVASVCTPQYLVNDMIVLSRSCRYVLDGKRLFYGGARGACLLGSIPAFGAFYAGQNWCACAPGALGGFTSYGPIAHEPTIAEMEKPVSVQPGSASITAANAKSPATLPSDWPMYRHDSGRSNATPASSPQKLEALWRKSLTTPYPDGAIGICWKERLCDPLTAPVVAEGVVVAAAVDRHQVIALDTATGSELWRQTVGGRIDSSPTIYQGLCLFGAHDGYLYALSLADGRLVWKLRAAALEERIVSYAEVESPWPVIGTVLVADGLAYASAGRTQSSDGGIVVRAVDPLSGKLVWSRAIATVPEAMTGRELSMMEEARLLSGLRKNDLLLHNGAALQLMLTRLDPKTGEIVVNATREFQKEMKKANKATNSKQKKAGADGKDETAPKVEKPAAPDEIVPGIGLEGFISGIWTRLGNRRYGEMRFGNLGGAMVSWGDKVVCVIGNQGDALQAVPRNKIQPVGNGKITKASLWKTVLPDGCQATAVIVCQNAVVVGGGVYEPGSKEGKGFLQLLSLDDGKQIKECNFDVPLAYNGIAVTEGRIYATLADGSIACMGAK